MKHEDRERMQDELLEYVYGCHEDPARIERALAEDSELAAMLQEVKRTAELLGAAARDEHASFRPRAPRSGDDASTRKRWRGARIAAAILGVLFLGPWVHWAVRAVRLGLARQSELRLVVSAPRSIPDGASALVHVESWDHSGDPVPAILDWQAFDASGKELERGNAKSAGAFDIALPAHLSGVRRVSVGARRGPSSRTVELTLDPEQSAPLVHLSTDKPLYRPGERVYWRAVLLERISLDPLEHACRVRIVDTRGTPHLDHAAFAEAGTAAGAWLIPAEAAGGEYALEVRDGSNEFTVERLPFVVRAFQPPQLEKEIDLDRKTYAPGETGVAEVRVSRVQGGVPAGARVEGSLVLDGSVVWNETAELDASGGALFRFRVPEVVERGEARFLARVIDGGVVETEIEPFVVPTGKLDVSFFPEGGELVAGLDCRVYVDVRDPLGRSIDARGRVVDAAGRTVADFATEHQGRGRISLVPSAGEKYFLEIDEPRSAPAVLPAVRAEGVSLRATVDSSPANEPLGLRVETLDAGPWIAAVFCRGTLVAQDPFEGAGEHELSIALPAEIAGVLRVTVFDAALHPVAERLVHRTSGRSIQVSIRPETNDLAPGDHQKLAVETRDETGRPVAAVVGLAVSDRALDALADEPRIGLAAQAIFFADAGELEDLGDFLPAEPDAASNMDLVLGTQGWRRFAWRDPADFVAREGESARRALLCEGHSDVPQVVDEDGNFGARVWDLSRQNRDAFGIAIVASLAVAAYLALAALARWLGGQRFTGRHPLLAAAYAMVVLIGIGSAVLQRFGQRMIPPGAEFAPALPKRMAMRENLEAEVVEERAELHADAEGEVMMLAAMDAPPGMPPLADIALAPAAGPVGAELGRRGLLAGRFDDDAQRKRAVAREEMAMLGYIGGSHIGFSEREYAHVHQPSEGVRTDFAETIYWNALLRTDAAGRAAVEFDLSDRVTTWVARADAYGAQRVGGGETRFEAKTPFHAQPVLPSELTVGDRVELPIALASSRPELARAIVSVTAGGPLALASQDSRAVELVDGRASVLVPVEARGTGSTELTVAAEAGGFRDLARHTVRVSPRGFPHRSSTSGVVRDRMTTTLVVPESYEEGSLALELVLYPSPLSDLMEGIEGMLQEPSGCFEQASSINYPNVLALAYMRAAGEEAPAIAARAQELLERGYAKLAGYECSEKGYEWFGSNPGHEALTAYGLLEFHDMASVFDVDGAMLERTRAWLLARRDGDGGYWRNDRALDSFGAAPREVTNAWITYTLALGGTVPAEIGTELDALESRALASEDAYVVALGAGALAEAGRGEAAESLRAKLKRMQQADGSLQGSTTSITRSGAVDLAVETTSLAVLAWLEDPDDLAPVERAVGWLRERRKNGGTFGATQATIQALRALTAHAAETRRIALPGTATLTIDGERIRTIEFGAGHRGALVFGDLAGHLDAGSNELTIELTGGNEFPWSLDFAYAADQPADDPDCVLALTTSLAADRVEEGESVSLAIELSNTTDEGQPMAIAIVGIPAGLEVSRRVLDDLKAAGRFDLWELSGREIVLYWRALEPRAEREVHVDLLARIPGRTTTPASRAYLYYTPDSKRWAEALSIEVSAAR